MGYLVDCFYAAGALNVQLVATVTKKNRPGYLLLIDSEQSQLDQIYDTIVKECGSSGWHKIGTEHFYVAVTKVTREIQVHLGKSSFQFTVSAKQIVDNGKNFRPEFEDCKRLKEKIMRDFQTDIPLMTIYKWVEKMFSNNSDNNFIIEEA